MTFFIAWVSLAWRLARPAGRSIGALVLRDAAILRGMGI